MALVLLGLALSLTACNSVLPGINLTHDVFLPKHPESLDLEDEGVQVRLITFEEAETASVDPKSADHDVKSDWNAAFAEVWADMKKRVPAEVTAADVPGNRSPSAANSNVMELGFFTFAKLRDYTGPRAPAAAPGGGPPGVLPAGLAAQLAAMLATEALKTAEKWMQDESKLYQATFEGTAVRDGFWAKDTGKWLQRYCAFEIVRTTKRHGPTDPSFKLICGLAPSADQSLFLVAPLAVGIHSSKAKVLSLRWFDIVPVFWYKAFLEWSNDVETDATVALEASWVRGDTLKTLNIPMFALAGFRSSLEKSGLSWHATEGSKPGIPGIMGWFQAVPRSDGADSYTASGAFKVKFTVIQRDTGNASKLLLNLRDEVKDERVKRFGE